MDPGDDQTGSVGPDLWYAVRGARQTALVGRGGQRTLRCFPGSFEALFLAALFGGAALVGGDTRAEWVQLVDETALRQLEELGYIGG